MTERPDFNDAIIMRRGASVEHVVSRTQMHIYDVHTSQTFTKKDS